MTIAIGILCQDGLVIAADTEENAGYMKYAQPKIMTALDSIQQKPRGICGIAGAGDAGYVDALSDELVDVFLSHPGLAGVSLRKVFETRLQEFYFAHIAPFNYRRDDRPIMDLLIGVQRQQLFQLYVTQDTTIRLRLPYAAIGAGAPFARSLLDRFWTPQCDTRAAQFLATYVIYMTKESIPGCGKFTHVTTLHGAKLDDKGATLLIPSLDITHLQWDQVDKLERLFMTEYAARERQLLWSVMAEHDDMIPKMTYGQPTPSAPVSPAEATTPTRPVPKRGRKGRPPSQG